jgi:hypothetical protein
VGLGDLKRELIRSYLEEGKRLAEIAKPETLPDAVSVLRQLAVWGLCQRRGEMKTGEFCP